MPIYRPRSAELNSAMRPIDSQFVVDGEGMRLRVVIMMMIIIIFFTPA